jgi:hypothetical protein
MGNGINLPIELPLIAASVVYVIENKGSLVPVPVENSGTPIALIVRVWNVN